MEIYGYMRESVSRKIISLLCNDKISDAIP